MVPQDHVRAVQGLRWGRSGAERIALGLPDPAGPLPVPFGRRPAERKRLGLDNQAVPARRRPIDVPPSKRRAEIFCFEHAFRVGVLTDWELITHHAEHPYPGTSGSVLALCPRCAREQQVFWSIDVRQLRTLRAAEPDRRKLDVRDLGPGDAGGVAPRTLSP